MINRNKFKADFGGKERTFWLGMGFLAMFLKSSKIELTKIQEAISENPFKVLPEMIYYSLKYGYDRVDAKPEFNIFNVTEWIDERGGVESDIIQLFMEKFSESMGINSDEVNKEAQKIVKKVEPNTEQKKRVLKSNT